MKEVEEEVKRGARIFFSQRLEKNRPTDVDSKEAVLTSFSRILHFHKLAAVADCVAVVAGNAADGIVAVDNLAGGVFPDIIVEAFADVVVVPAVADCIAVVVSTVIDGIGPDDNVADIVVFTALAVSLSSLLPLTVQLMV